MAYPFCKRIRSGDFDEEEPGAGRSSLLRKRGDCKNLKRFF